ncbi:MAG: hypothetical protein II425_03095 [Oscillospiraceae bacterium]|nr:hypothetical protein [Oscillospiraceae bacterium]
MARTKQDIIDCLLKALEQGNGDLDELDRLMDHAKEDIAKAKEIEKAEQARKEAEQRKRGEKIAEMATRVLNDQTTDADLALVMESYMHARGMKDAKVTEADVVNAAQAAEKATSMFDDLLKAFDTLGAALESKPATTKVAKNKTSDDVIKEFLNTLR